LRVFENINQYHHDLGEQGPAFMKVILFVTKTLGGTSGEDSSLTITLCPYVVIVEAMLTFVLRFEPLHTGNK
jgi:hypothetical protein